SAEITRHGAEQRAHDRRHAHDDETDKKRNARAREHAREDVAAELVEAERMRGRRADEPHRQLLRGRIRRRERRSHGRQQRDDDHDGGADLHHHAGALIATPYSYRIRGSRNPYARSVRRLTETYVAAM